MVTCKDPVRCIVPPDILEHMARRGNERERDWALSTMATDQSLRAARIQAAASSRTDVLAALAAGKLERTIYDAQGQRDARTTAMVRHESDPPVDDPVVNESYDGFGTTYGFYLDVFNRNSIDDQGLPLDGVVHYGVSYDNALWDGHRMIFGDGDDQFLRRLTRSLDVIAHELTHGVTQYTAKLDYYGQSGALNESISDVFGSLVRQYSLKQKAADADWLIGADVIGPAVNGRALRSLAAPGTAYDDWMGHKDPQPAHMQNFVNTDGDAGGVHINSGIPNRAFYIAATALGDYAWKRAGRIWYEALRNPSMAPGMDFVDFANVTIQSAASLFGPDGEEAKAVVAGWHEVGIDLS